MKTALLFPGQGAQYVGMGKDIHDNHPAARRTFEEASEALGEDLAALCFAGPKERLSATENTQPAILTVSVAILRVLREQGLPLCDVAAGLSLGEYSALVAAGALDFAAAVRVVRQRGRFMQEAVPPDVGAMAAIIGLDTDRVEQVCEEAAAQGLVQPVNYNCPGQIVISGERAAVGRAVELAEAAGARMAVALDVSAPFHCRLMEPAGRRLAEVLAGVEVSDPAFPVLANVNARPVTRRDQIVSALTRQVSSPVLWEMSVRRMAEMGVGLFLEIGPGRTLTGFSKRIVSGPRLANVEDAAGVERVLEMWRENG